MILGLTGGIASGKSTVANFFKEIGIEVIDADIVAKEIRNTPSCLKEIRKKFGDEVFISEYELNIERFREVVFADKEKLNTLNNIIHPLVIEEFQKIRNENIQNTDSKKIIVFDIPLLFESKMEYLCDKILLVYTSRENQIQRLEERNGFSTELSEKIIDSQMNLNLKLKNSDYSLENSSSLEELKMNFQVLLSEILKK